MGCNLEDENNLPQVVSRYGVCLSQQQKGHLGHPSGHVRAAGPYLGLFQKAQVLTPGSWGTVLCVTSLVGHSQATSYFFLEGKPPKDP